MTWRGELAGLHVSRMPQSWNPAAVRVAARVLFRQPALAVPHLEVGGRQGSRSGGGCLHPISNRVTCACRQSPADFLLHLLTPTTCSPPISATPAPIPSLSTWQAHSAITVTFTDVTKGEAAKALVHRDPMRP